MTSGCPSTTAPSRRPPPRPADGGPVSAPRSRGARHARTRHLVAALVVAPAIALAACGGPSAGGAPPGAGHPTITIRDFAYSPSTLRVHPGATVSVADADSVPHTLTADDGSFGTGTLQPGASVVIHAPTQPGTYPYRCDIHQYMHGTLIVSS